MNHVKSSALRAVSTLAIIIGAPSSVYAQANAIESPSTPATSQAGPVEGDIVVTAQRRTESLQKTSLAIQVLADETLRDAGVTQTGDLAKLTPGLQIASNGSQPQVYIRGVGDYGATAVSNPAVAFNVDGVYIARPQAVTGSFFDLERVEVLKGPQGTLYGRNASGGAINVIAARPNFSELSGNIQLRAQNYGGVSSDGALNLPISSTLAVRAAYQLVSRDGYLSDGANDDKQQNVRLQLLWRPDSALSVLLWGSYSHQGGKGTNFVLLDEHGNPAIGRPGTSGLDPWTSVASPQANALIAAGNAAITAARGPSPAVPYLIPLEGEPVRQNNDLYNVHAEISWDAGFATLTVIPAYQEASLNYLIEPTFTYATHDLEGNPETSRATSIEARLSHESARLKWVVGSFYYLERQHIPSIVNGGFLQHQHKVGDQRTQSYAVFGQASYSVTPSLRLIGGLRYTDETKRLSNSAVYGLAPSAGCFPGGPTCFFTTLDGETKAHKVSWKGGVELDLAPENMLYATAASGFKSGGISLARVAPFRPEKLTAYEFGSRNRFLDGMLQVNAELFYWDYKDHQEQIIGTDDIGSVGPIIRNAGSARSYGANLDISVRATANDRFHVAVEYLNSKYDNFTFQQPTAFTARGATGCTVTPTGTVGAAGPISNVDCSGFQLIRAPKWTGSASYSHSFDLQAGRFKAGADVTFASSRWLTTDFVPNARAKAYAIGNANLSFTPRGTSMTISAFVHNITDTAVYTGGVQSPFIPGFIAAAIGAPRTYGGGVNVKF